VVGVEVGSRRWNIFQVQFSPRDGSIFVNFPYFQHTTGIVSAAALGPGSSGQLKLEVGGRIASHLVKYSHHPDGIVHFSQDGRVISAVRKQGVPLAQLDGHFFTVHATGLERFRASGPKDVRDRLPNPRRTSLSFRLTGRRPRSVKFVGRLHLSDSLERMLPDRGVLEPKVMTLSPDGTIRPTFVCSSPAGSRGQDRFLLLSCEPMAGFARGRGSSLLFIGGFDAPAITSDQSKPTTMLAFSYPVRNAEELRRRIGSIDFRGSQPEVGGAVEQGDEADEA
jgi:hypothetical protein